MAQPAIVRAKAKEIRRSIKIISFNEVMLIYTTLAISVDAVTTK